jgi:ABC-type lipoprotein release transport system permease subunit
MKLILSLGFRNLFRQKRRTILLGAAIAFGMMILVIANSFALGISDNLFNRMIVYMSGHMEISMMKDSRQWERVIRDKDRFISIIKKNIPDIKQVEESVSIMTNAIGNRKSEFTIIVGAENNTEMMNYYKQFLIEGSIDDYINGKIENPVILYDAKAKGLAVKAGDTIKISLKTVTGQMQTARLTVAAIIRSANMFQSMAAFVELKTVKQLLNLKPYETAALQVNFKKINDPRFVIEQADKLYKLLTPEIAIIYGNAISKKTNESATVLGFFNNEQEMALLKKNITIQKGAIPDKKSGKKAMISAKLAEKLGIKTGDAFKYSYKTKFENKTIENEYIVAAVFNSKKIPAENIILLNENEFYKTYLENLPAPPAENRGVYIPNKTDVLYSVFSPEWKLLPRTPDAETLQKKMTDMQKTKWKGPWLDVRTMYESASQVIKLEGALRLITLIAVIILFFIILIGVINSLRMTIRERTREIGTVRAIGMQTKDVRNLFITETLLLSLLACIAGIILGIIIMKLTGLITIDTSSIFSILLVDKHLYFMPSAVSITIYVILILLISGFTAFFPARRAAKLSAADALRHYE